jgi:signal transduction histidine kinase
MRRRISRLVLATTSAVVVAFVIPHCLLVRTLAEDRATAAADQEGRNVAILVASLPDGEQLTELVTALDARASPSTAVLTATGRVIGSGQISAADPEVQRALAGEAFTVVDDDGGRALLPVVGPDGTAVVRTSVTPEQLHSGVVPAWAGIIGLGIVLLLGAQVVSARLGRRVSNPVRAVADTAHRLREGDLTARAPVQGTEETVELAEALNGLAERTTELLASERASVADLSHRLRTPVTALRLDTEAVGDPELAQRMATHVRTLQRSIDAIVAEARRPVRTELPARCDAIAVLRDRADFWKALADEQGRPFAIQLPEHGVSVALASEDLADLVDVLIDNVFLHTREATRLRVEAFHSGTALRIEVADGGPGFDRATPDPGSGRRLGSTGLGLDIARRIVVGCGGGFRLDRAPEGGALVVMELPIRS